MQRPCAARHAARDDSLVMAMVFLHTVMCDWASNWLQHGPCLFVCLVGRASRGGAGWGEGGGADRSRRLGTALRGGGGRGTRFTARHQAVNALQRRIHSSTTRIAYA